MSKNVSRNVAHDRPESQNIKLDVFSVMKKNEKKNRPETAGLFSWTGARKQKNYFWWTSTQQRIRVATSNRLSQKTIPTETVQSA